MTNKEKREIAVQALKACNARILAFANQSNPQIKDMYIKNKGYQAALEDMILLLDGNSVQIKALF